MKTILNLRTDTIYNLLQLRFPFELDPMNAILHETLTAALSIFNMSQILASVIVTCVAKRL